MSAQAGVWNFDGKPADSNFLKKVSDTIVQYGPDGEDTHFDGSVGMLYRPVYTTLESRHERQPHISRSGLVITWDGRLDNREDLSLQLVEEVAGIATDVAIVGAALERWGTACFSKLIGDWAISIWNPANKTLTLAKDYIGVRHLFYYLTRSGAVWCTYLKPLIVTSGAKLTVDDEYIAGYLTRYPEAHLTPFREIATVPPGAFVVIANGNASAHSYWTCEPRRSIRYQTDAEYEAHFRHVFRNAVRRRLRSDSAVLAELSGGLDSSSIVCIADDILAKSDADAPGLDTVSLYDSQDAVADERQFFTVIEKRRGKAGHHFDRRQFETSLYLGHHEVFPVPSIPEGVGGLSAALLDLIQTHGYRVVLSGMGGDEFLGGAPNPLPQLADLIVRPRPLQLARQLTAWSMVKKRPAIQLLCQAIVSLLPVPIRARYTEKATTAPWINTEFSRRCRISRRQLDHAEAHGHWQPSQRSYIQTFMGMRSQLAFFRLHGFGFEERRYPYLDQTLIEFLMAIPKTQLLRPGQRRSLMRRALHGLVPSEILWRRTKGYAARGIIEALDTSLPELTKLFASPVACRLGYVSQKPLEDYVQSALAGDASQLIALTRTIYLELWLRSLAESGILDVTRGSVALGQRTPLFSPRRSRSWISL